MGLDLQGVPQGLGSAWEWSALSQGGQQCQEGKDSVGRGHSQEQLLFKPVGRALADPLPAFPRKHPRLPSSRGAMCPELNSPLETDERLQRV